MTSLHHQHAQHAQHPHMGSANGYMLSPSPPKAVPVAMDDAAAHYALASRHAHMLHSEAAAAQHAQNEAHAQSMQMSTSGPSSLHTVPVGAS
jgi:hypothetical protein